MITVCRRPLAVVVLLACASWVSCAHRAAGEVPAVWQLRGAIVDVSHDALRVRHKSGQVVDLLLDDHTVVMRGDRRESQDALSRGRRVRVDVEPLPGGAQRARTVRVYGRS